MNCDHCGATLDGAINFCNHCGSSIEAPSPVSTPKKQKTSRSSKPLLLVIIILLILAILILSLYKGWIPSNLFATPTSETVAEQEIDEGQTTSIQEEDTTLQPEISVTITAPSTQESSDSVATETDSSAKASTSTETDTATDTPDSYDSTTATTATTALSQVGLSTSHADYISYYDSVLSYYIDIPTNFTIIFSDSSQTIFSDSISQIAVNSQTNTMNLTPETYLAQYGSTSVYARTGDNFYAESDYTDNGDIYYHYAYITSGTIVSFTVTYPESQRSFFDDALDTLIDGLIIES